MKQQENKFLQHCIYSFSAGVLLPAMVIMLVLCKFECHPPVTVSTQYKLVPVDAIIMQDGQTLVSSNIYNAIEPCHLNIGDEVVVEGCGWDFLGIADKNDPTWERYNIYLLGYRAERFCGREFTSTDDMTDGLRYRTMVESWRAKGYKSFCLYQRGVDWL
jgi:hypothetical protein